MTPQDSPAADFRADPGPYEETVRPEWIDYNGHMNVAYYLLVFDHASDALLDQLGLGVDYCKHENSSLFAVETHITYEREVLEGDGLRIKTRILGYDAKRLHLFHEMYHAGTGDLAATNEVMLLHVDMKVRRTAGFPVSVLGRIEPIFKRHQKLGLPPQAGRAIKVPKALI